VLRKCPRCLITQDYKALLLQVRLEPLSCKQCGVSLRVRKAWLFPYVVVINFVASMLGLSMMLSGQYLTSVALVLAWLALSVAVYPLVVVLAVDAPPPDLPRTAQFGEG
jgi:uncharacterized protein (DUF983 family)